MNTLHTSCCSFSYYAYRLHVGIIKLAGLVLLIRSHLIRTGLLFQGLQAPLPEYHRAAARQKRSQHKGYFECFHHGILHGFDGWLHMISGYDHNVWLFKIFEGVNDFTPV